jgi:hypothetical protein
MLRVTRVKGTDGRFRKLRLAAKLLHLPAQRQFAIVQFAIVNLQSAALDRRDKRLTIDNCKFQIAASSPETSSPAGKSAGLPSRPLPACPAGEKFDG